MDPNTIHIFNIWLHCSHVVANCLMCYHLGQRSCLSFLSTQPNLSKYSLTTTFQDGGVLLPKHTNTYKNDISKRTLCDQT